MKKIIFVTPNLSNGGAERVTAVLANELALQGLSVEVAFMKDDCIAYQLDESVTVCKLFADGNRIYKIIFKILRLRKMMANNPEAVFVAMLPFETLYTYIAGIGKHCRIVYSLRNDPANMNSGLDRFIKKRIYPKAQCIVFQTEDARNYFPESVRKKGVVIANPISENLPERYRGERRREIVTVGRMTKQKNYPLLLKAFSNVYRIHPDWKLRIWGKGIMEKELRQLCEELDIKDVVEFCGFKENVIEKINQSGMFVLSSDYEGISNAMLEALATGVPCICTDCPVGGARMMIRDHENGILVPIQDEKRLTEAILELIEHPGTAERFSDNSVKIKELLSAKRIVGEWRKVLD